MSAQRKHDAPQPQQHAQQRATLVQPAAHPRLPRAVKLAKVPLLAAIVVDHHLRPLRLAARAQVMHEHRVMHIVNLAPRLAHAVAQVGVLAIQKVVLVEARERATEHHARAHHLLGLDGRAEVAVGAPVAPEQARAREQFRQHALLAEDPPQREVAGAGGLDAPVGVAQLPAADGCVGVGVHKLYQPLQRAWLGANV
ncbi:hypothetical protein CEN46_22330, partial [Fischerella thermalis CCMEE 5318]